MPVQIRRARRAEPDVPTYELKTAMTLEPLDPAAIELAATTPDSDVDASVDVGVDTGVDVGVDIGVDLDAVFSLITQVLPLEICLYHRIIPLSLRQNRLMLGMVDPSDTDALDYATRLASYQGLAVEPVDLVGSLHHTLLSAYLNHLGQAADSARPEAAESDLPEPVPPQVVSPQVSSQVNPQVNPQVNSQAIPQATLLLDESLLTQPDAPPLDWAEMPPAAGGAIATGVALLPLNVSIQHLTEPIEAIALLPPPQFLAELFGRILTAGITRVLLGSGGGTGRIAWDRNGMAQLALGQIEPHRFRALVAELKAGVGLTPQLVQHPLRRTVMRSYRGQPLMLKLSLEPPGLNAMNSIQGAEEKIQMQVLRGALLIAHERERLGQLQREALETAELLQRKLQQMQTLTQILPVLQPTANELDQLTAVVQSYGSLLPDLAFASESGDRQHSHQHSHHEQGDRPEAHNPPSR